MPVQCDVKTLSNAVNLLLMYNKQIDHKYLNRETERARERKEGKTNDGDDDDDDDRHRTFRHYVCEHKYILKREPVFVCACTKWDTVYGGVCTVIQTHATLSIQDLRLNTQPTPFIPI